jgi:hypothetical protein
MDCNWFGLVLQVEGAAGGSLPELAKAWEVAIRQAGVDSFPMPFNPHFCEKNLISLFLCKLFFGILYFLPNSTCLLYTARHVYAYLMALNLDASEIDFLIGPDSFSRS